MKTLNWMAAFSMTAMFSFAPSALAGTITVTATEPLRNSTGTLRCALWTQDGGFPGQSENADTVSAVSISANSAVCSLEGVKAGKYAFSILHYENDNKKIDVMAYGAPTEGYATSNNAAPLPTSPPSFEGAVFEFDGSAVKLTLDMRYPAQRSGVPPGQ